jgi:hypothetical protein
MSSGPVSWGLDELRNIYLPRYMYTQESAPTLYLNLFTLIPHIPGVCSNQGTLREGTSLIDTSTCDTLESKVDFPYRDGSKRQIRQCEDNFNAVFIRTALEWAKKL